MQLLVLISPREQPDGSLCSSVTSKLFSNDFSQLSYLFHGRLVQFQVLMTRLQPFSDTDILRAAHKGDLEETEGDCGSQNQAQQPVSLHHNDINKFC